MPRWPEIGRWTSSGWISTNDRPRFASWSRRFSRRILRQATRTLSSPPYFLALRSKSLKQAADEIAYHATSGIHNPPAGTLLQECTGWAVGTIPFDSTGRIGLLRALAALGLAITRRTGHGGAGPTAAENARLEELALRILSVPAA